MNPASEMADDDVSKKRLFTFRSGGWVVVLSGVFAIIVIVWAVAPALVRSGPRPIGDRRNVETYGFDWSTCLVPQGRIVAGGMRKDALRALVDPPVFAGREIADYNAELYGKYLVSSDRVIGVEINGEERAYPLRVLNCHEIVNDTLGGVHIAVTYNPPCDSVVVVGREVDGEILEFGVSGLLYNSNLLMFDRRPNADGESLWSQLQARAIAGPAAADARTLRVLPASLVRWGDWLAARPKTTVLELDRRMFKRYQETNYEPYFMSPQPMFPVNPAPPADGLAPKARVVAVTAGGERRVYAYSGIANRCDASGQWTDELGGVALVFEYSADSETVMVAPDPPDAPIEVEYSFWFAWYAMYPEDDVLD